MPVAGALRDLGIPDLLQLVDMSRKTGRLQVTSETTGQQAIVWFDAGYVAHAAIDGRPATPEELLVVVRRVSAADLDHARWFAQRQRESTTALVVLMEAFAITTREVERLCTEHLENVLFELLGWRDGQFVFEDRVPADVPAGPARLSAQSLLMENARRTDEWSRIADRIPHLGVVPVIARGAGTGTPIDLQPREWELLTLVDGRRDLRALAAAMACAPFEVAGLLYALLAAGVLELT